MEKIRANIPEKYLENRDTIEGRLILAFWKQPELLDEYKLNPKDLEIRVELARDLKNSGAERKKIWKGQVKSKKNNDRIKDRLAEYDIALTGENLLKYKLYEQQNEMSPYTQKKIIPFSSLFDKRLYDIDHIIPKSRYYTRTNTSTFHLRFSLLPFTPWRV